MLVGVPKEIKPSEFRVGMTPAAVREYVAHGHQVLVETKAGEGISAGDDAYRAAGATIAATAAEVFAKPGMIVKVKEPQPGEWKQLRAVQILFTYLHLAADAPQAKGLMASGVTAVAYETVTDARGSLPLLAPMSEVAGRLSVQAAATALQKATGGRGILLGGVPGVAPGKVAIIGGGVVGTHAATVAAGIGATVTVLDRSLPRLRDLDDMFEGRIVTRYATRDAIAEEVAAADAVIGAVLVPGAAAPKLVTRAMLSTMKPGAVLVDVAIDQGGCFETSHATTHTEPVYFVDGVIHYCVSNMPAAVPHTSTLALTNATFPYLLELANHGLEGACQRYAALREGVNTYKGFITYKGVGESQGRDWHAMASVVE